MVVHTPLSTFHSPKLISWAACAVVATVLPLCKYIQLRIGNLQLDNVCGDVSFKTSAEFSSINDISSILCSFLRVHTSNGLDCFRALEAIKDRHIGAQDALNFVSREGAVSELVDEKLAPLLSTLFVPA